MLNKKNNFIHMLGYDLFIHILEHDLTKIFYINLILNIDYKLNNYIYKKLIKENDRFFKTFNKL
jgi:hypothetical protein